MMRRQDMTAGIENEIKRAAQVLSPYRYVRVNKKEHGAFLRTPLLFTTCTIKLFSFKRYNFLYNSVKNMKL